MINRDIKIMSKIYKFKKKNICLAIQKILSIYKKI